jgi:hypothetical protein
LPRGSGGQPGRHDLDEGNGMVGQHLDEGAAALSTRMHVGGR